MNRRELVKTGAAAAVMSGSFGALVSTLVAPEKPMMVMWLLPPSPDPEFWRASKDWERDGASKRWEITSYGNIWLREGERLADVLPWIKQPLNPWVGITNDENQSVVSIIDGKVVFGEGWRGSEASAVLWEALAAEMVSRLGPA